MGAPRHGGDAAYDQAAHMDRLVFQERDRLIVGADSLHGLDPAELTMRLEEAEADPATISRYEREAVRSEIFCGLLEYLFADGIEPEQIRLRIEGFLISFQPALVPRLKGPTAWVERELIAEVVRKYRRALNTSRAVARSRGALSTWMRELEREVELDFLRDVISRLIGYLLSEGLRWKALVAVAYCLAKNHRAHLLGGMSLEDVAILSGDKGGRATPSDRCMRLYNRFVAAAGAKACHLHHQKSATAAETYSQAQRGNTNRRKSTRRRKP
jgi:hypothetical protein